MNLIKDKISEYITFIMDDAIRPSIVMDIHGDILYRNTAFSDEINCESVGNMNDLLADQSLSQWQNFLSNRADLANSTIQAVLNTAARGNLSVSINVMYVAEKQQVLALFNLPRYSSVEESKNYIHAFQKSDGFLALVDTNGIIYDVNEQHMQFFSLPKSYFVGQPLEVIISLFSHDSASLFEHMKDVVKYGNAETVVQYKQTAELMKHYNITTFFDKKTEMFLMRINDHTEKWLLKDRIAHADSLSMVGELAASIAHEIRNPMTTLKGFTQLLKVAEPTDTMRYIMVIESEIKRMEGILNEMLVLSKPPVNEKTIFSLKRLVDEMVEVIQPKALMEGITIINENISFENTLICGQIDKLKQVLLNIFKNGFEAMSSGGTLTISMVQRNSEEIILTIKDSGKGMSKNQVRQLFVPFFTSKERGTGLGLPFVLKTIEEQGGNVFVESVIEEGTSIIVSLPLVRDANEKGYCEYIKEGKLTS